MRIHFEIHIGRRHLAYLPAMLATLAAFLVLGIIRGGWAALIVGATYGGSAVVLAAIDCCITWVRDWRYERQLVRSIDAHPAQLKPRHARRKRGATKADAVEGAGFYASPVPAGGHRPAA